MRPFSQRLDEVEAMAKQNNVMAKQNNGYLKALMMHMGIDGRC
jgi:hypothetical protein